MPMKLFATARKTFHAKKLFRVRDFFSEVESDFKKTRETQKAWKKNHTSCCIVLVFCSCFPLFSQLNKSEKRGKVGQDFAMGAVECRADALRLLDVQ